MEQRGLTVASLLETERKYPGSPADVTPARFADCHRGRVLPAPLPRLWHHAGGLFCVSLPSTCVLSCPGPIAAGGQHARGPFCVLLPSLPSLFLSLGSAAFLIT
jgi:hypothetical protein